ncbi:uncharacterized protein ACA1_333960 [Acanthamoeba castellanii str. Neff]|uniref:RanBP2-type domain-containing protein n=1 Tax=Acanthamoeba castellanii (strain ATCC 30010 / Neff) TaxID=1257118 RepID=L8GNN1_ACACF|nr:uncharacterized protein ACA1_333960 [Acanthamoeba castellanii str. Neff]ELR14358.1 hypothetical protein ACA1_333960 [Acanthamoeba castellanii str. Neff]
MQCAGELPPPPLPHRPEAPSAPVDEFSDEDLESDDAKTHTEASLSDEVVCPTCGYCNDAVTNYCVECGRPLGATRSRASSVSGSPTASRAEPPSMATKTIKATTSPATTTTSAAGARGGAATEETKLPPLASRARFLKWIVIATLVLNVALFLGIPSPRPVWLFTTDHGLPWFIYPLAVSVILCGSLYLASHNVEKPWLQLHLLVSATINFTIIFTYVFKFDRQPYFAYVLLPSAGLLCLHLLLTDHWGVMPRPHKYFYVHLVSIYVPLNLVLFTAFLTTTPGEAWFVFPLLLTSVPLMAHYIIAFHPDDPHKWFYVDLATVSTLAGLFFLLWAVTPTDHPWFVYLWVAGGVVIAGHYVFEYQPKVLQRGAAGGLGLLQGAWAKAHELRMPSWRKEADKAPPVVTPEVGSSQPTPGSQV